MTWNEDFFTLLYQEIFMSRKESEIDFDVELIQMATNVREGSVVDFCCGVGDILAGFEKKGFSTYGVDFSKDYVGKANKEYQQHNVFQGDALTYQFGKEFDLSINWFSSFGYFDDDRNKQLLTNISNHTKKQGKFALEIYNTYDLVRNYKDSILYEKEYLGEVVKVKRDSNLILTTRILEQKWLLEYRGNTYQYTTQNRVYFMDEIIQKLKQSGFSKVDVFERSKEKHVLKSPDLNSMRLLFIGEK